YAQSGVIAPPARLQIGLHGTLDPDAAGRDQALAAIDIAAEAGLNRLAIDGVVLADAAAALSLPGLLNYFSPELLGSVLAHARAKGVLIESANQVDIDTISRQIWSTLNTARAMGFDLGKYALFPLTLEQCEAVVAEVQA